MMDFVDEMTKEELVWWIKDNCFFRMPRKSEVLFYRWQVKTKKLQKRSQAHIAAGKRLNLKKRDEYARQFNASEDINERIRLLKKMEPFDNALQSNMKEGKLIDAAYKKLDKLYAQIDVERKKELDEKNSSNPLMAL